MLAIPHYSLLNVQNIIMTLYFSNLFRKLITDDVVPRGSQVYLAIMYTKINKAYMADMSLKTTYMKIRQETPHATP